MASRRICADVCSSRFRNPEAAPILLATVAAAKSSGATVLAICNTPGAPLVTSADLIIEVRAGLETSVAATKSYLATLAAIARMVAAWTGNRSLGASLDELPNLMDRSWALDWSSALPTMVSADHLYVVGRGLGLSAAQEVALKCKETCGLHAEAFSSAELRHGPFALLKQGFPALLLAQPDATRPAIAALANELAQRGVDGAHRRTAGGRRDRVADDRDNRGTRSDPDRAERLSYDRIARRATRLRSGSSAPFAQDHEDSLMRTALTNGRILTPRGIVSGQTLLLSGAHIEALVPASKVGRGEFTVDLGNQLLLPGFIDVQVNGGGGVLFNDAPSLDSIRAIGAAHRRFGTTGFLPTLISDDLDTIGRAIDAVQSAIDAGVPGVLGIHIEGPFLNWGAGACTMPSIYGCSIRACCRCSANCAQAARCSRSRRKSRRRK